MAHILAPLSAIFLLRKINDGRRNMIGIIIPHKFTKIEKITERKICIWRRVLFIAPLSWNKKIILIQDRCLVVPDVGIELTTYCLQDSCSTTELIRRKFNDFDFIWSLKKLQVFL